MNDPILEVLSGQEITDVDIGEITEAAETVSVPSAAQIFEPGAECDKFIIVISGSVRVQMVTESGREIVLYRVGPGETCILTTSCLLAGLNYGAQGVAETDVEALVVPGKFFEDYIGRSQGFRRFVFAAFGDRIAKLMALLNEVAFERIDRRLAEFLLAQANEDGCVEITHQALATELGSAREVISRNLKEFERRAWIALSRGNIRILRPPALARISENGDL